MWRSLHAKFLLSVAPVFILASALGLSWLAAHDSRRHLEELTARVGNHAAQIAGIMGRRSVMEDEAIAWRVLATLLADTEVQCAEVNLPELRARHVLAPRAIGCLGQEPGEQLEVGINGVPQGRLLVRFSTAEIEEARRARREFSLLVIACGFVLAIGSGVLGFHWTVGAPLGRLLAAIRETSISGRFRLVDRAGADEIGQVTEAFNIMQINLQSRDESLSTALRDLTDQNTRFDAALRNMSQGLCMLDTEHRVVICNERFARMYGLTLDLKRTGASILDLLNGRLADEEFGRFGGCARSSLQNLLDSCAQGRLSAVLPDGRTIAISCEPMPGGGWVTTHEDVTERRRSEARVAHMARHDALTDLGNRILFQERIERALLHLHSGEEVAVLYLDLDRFKVVNDTLGHAVGDALLREVADRLRSCVREVDTIARLGGDEFALVQVGASQPSGSASLARRLVAAVGAPYEIDGHQVKVGTSVGIAIAPRDGTDADQLMKNADMALYRAKGAGRGCFKFFEPSMSARAQERRGLEADLRDGLARGEFELYYQPLVHLATNEVISMEALLRWRHSQRGLVPPSDFIPVAEEIGLIGHIGTWVLQQACAEAVRWPDRIRVAVNISALQFKDSSLVAIVAAALRASGLPPSRLEVEITETAMLQDGAAALAVMQQLRMLGVRISLDDFGTGYSSLSYLRRYPVDKIKIDRSFICNLPDESNSVAIVNAVIALGVTLGICTVAEGVETQEQLELLRLRGCTEAQGFLLSRPVPVSEIPQLLSSAERGSYFACRGFPAEASPV